MLLLLITFPNMGNAEEIVIPTIKYELSGGAGYYDYAPSFIIDKYGIIYGFICENKDPFKIVDHIYLYKGIPTQNGYMWQPRTLVLSPSDAPWDNCHICDPDVREFKTHYKGETYNYIMTYLGVDQWDCNHNQIGIAVAKNIEGPYTRVGNGLFIPYNDRSKWGVGQSTTIVKNDQYIDIYYHSTTENGPYCMREVKLDDLDNIRIGEEHKVPNLPANSYPALSRNRIFMASEYRTYKDDTIPTWVGDVCRLAYRPLSDNILREKDNWIEIGRVNPSLSHFPRNHNPGLLTDTKGYLPDENKIVMFFTPAVTGESWLWSYDLYSATFYLDDYFKDK